MVSVEKSGVWGMGQDEGSLSLTSVAPVYKMTVHPRLLCKVDHILRLTALIKNVFLSILSLLIVTCH